MSTLRRLSRQATHALTRLLFGESPQLVRVGLPGMPKPCYPWYLSTAGFFRLFFRIWARWERIGLENIPRRGGVMLVSNHLSAADPPLLTAALFSRWPKYMAKIELFQTPGSGFIVALSGAFPVRRFDADIGALREAVRKLERGETVVMFPEGHRSDSGALIEAYPGTAMIALRSRTPVVPVAITGSEAFRRGWRVFFHRPRVRVVFGRPFRLPHEGPLKREAVETASLTIMREIALRLPARYRGVYRERFADLPAEATIDLVGEPARSA